MVDAAVYFVELDNINSGQRLVFNIVTNNLTRFIREWNADNVMKIWQVTKRYRSVRVEIYENEQTGIADNRPTNSASSLAVHRQISRRCKQKGKRNGLWQRGC